MNIKDDISKKINELIMKERYHAIDFLSKENISYAVVKGAVLSNLCYNNVFSRGIGDIDILIPKGQINQLEKKLVEQEFYTPHDALHGARFQRIFMLTNSHQLLPYHKKLSQSELILDVNFDIFWGEYEGKRIDMEMFLSDAIETSIFQQNIKSLPPIKALIQLILHHYKDMNSIFLLATRKCIKYQMFKDIYFLLKNNPHAISLEKLYSISTEYEIIPYVFYVLYYTGQIFDDTMLNHYIAAFRTPEGEALLNSYGLCEKERKEWKYNFKTRLEEDNLYGLIKDDLTSQDRAKININKSIFKTI